MGIVILYFSKKNRNYSIWSPRISISNLINEFTGKTTESIVRTVRPSVSENVLLNAFLLPLRFIIRLRKARTFQRSFRIFQKHVEKRSTKYFSFTNFCRKNLITIPSTISCSSATSFCYEHSDSDKPSQFSVPFSRPWTTSASPKGVWNQRTPPEKQVFMNGSRLIWNPPRANK